MNNPFKEIELKPVQPVVETVAQEHKRLLEPIPDELWCTYSFQHGDRSCALGHLAFEKKYLVRTPNVSYSGFWDKTMPEREPSRTFMYEQHGESIMDISTVNNGDSVYYQQPTPKARVMALLDDMIAAGY